MTRIQASIFLAFGILGCICLFISLRFGNTATFDFAAVCFGAGMGFLVRHLDGD